MIYLLLAGICAFFGVSSGMGTGTLLRPLIDILSPLTPGSAALLCTMAAFGAALICAFFALGQPLALHQDELLLLSVGAAVGGVLGDLVYMRLIAMIPEAGVHLLVNALLFALLALAYVYFSALSQRIRPLSITRLGAFPAALLIGLAAAFLAFGAQSLTLMLYYLLFDAEHDESATAALTVSLFAMAGKLIMQLIRLRLNLPDADILLWLLPGALLGALLAMIPALQPGDRQHYKKVLEVGIFTALLNVVAALL